MTTASLAEADRAKDARLAFALWKCAAYSIFSGGQASDANDFFERGYSHYLQAERSVADEETERKLRADLPLYFLHGSRYSEEPEFTAGVAWAQLLDNEYRLLTSHSETVDSSDAVDVRVRRAKQKFADANCLLLAGQTE
jgi:hypothetical protein